jgi:hypothetical protein
MRDGRVNWHAASSGSTPQPHERDDSIAQVDKPLRIDAEVLENIRQLTHSASDAFAPVENRLPRAHLRGLDVFDVWCPEVQINLRGGVEHLVSLAHPLNIAFRHVCAVSAAENGGAYPGIKLKPLRAAAALSPSS